jgi:hypothetical protein
MEEMKWVSSAMLSMLAANNLGFHLMALAEICQTFSQHNLGFGLARSAKRTWLVQNQPHRAFLIL